MIKTTTLLLCLVLASCAAEPEAEIQWTNLPADKERTARELIAGFFDTCPKLWAGWRDVLEAEATISEVGDSHYLKDRQGWKDYVLLKVQMKDDLYRFHQMGIGGHIFWYFLGTGATTGVFGQKPEGRAVCDGGYAPDDDKGWFKAAPHLAIVSTLKH